MITQVSGTPQLNLHINKEIFMRKDIKGSFFKNTLYLYIIVNLSVIIYYFIKRVLLKDSYYTSLQLFIYIIFGGIGIISSYLALKDKGLGIYGIIGATTVLCFFNSAYRAFTMNTLLVNGMIFLTVIIYSFSFITYRSNNYK